MITYYLMIMNSDDSAEEHLNVIKALESSVYRNINYNPDKLNLITFVGDKLELPLCVKNLDLKQNCVIEAHEEGDNRRKFSLIASKNRWEEEVLLPLFPANHVLNFF